MAVIGGTHFRAIRKFYRNFGTGVEEWCGLDADYRLDQSWYAFAGLGVTHDDYTGSKPGFGGAYEPFSSTLQVSSTFGAAYGF